MTGPRKRTRSVSVDTVTRHGGRPVRIRAVRRHARGKFEPNISFEFAGLAPGDDCALAVGADAVAEREFKRSDLVSDLIDALRRHGVTEDDGPHVRALWRAMVAGGESYVRRIDRMLSGKGGRK